MSLFRRKWCLLPLLGVAAGCQSWRESIPPLPHATPPTSIVSPSSTAGPSAIRQTSAQAEELPSPREEAPPLIDLATALRLADAQNPEIALARERIREALAQQQRAEMLWLPNVDFGSTWLRHDGQIQRATGEVLDVSRSSLFVGVGPGLSVDLSEALFAPLAARQITNARAAGAAGVTNDRLLDVAVAYTDLLQAYAELRISDETLRNAKHLQQITESFEKVGKTALADVARARTEVQGRERERQDITGRIAVYAARLARLLLMAPETPLRPVEAAVVPIALVPENLPATELVAQALLYRPELAENRAVTEAAIARWRAARSAPLTPTLAVGSQIGGFGGGRNSDFANFDFRSDVAAQAVWHLHSLGLGNLALQRERRSQINQTLWRQQSLEAAVAADVVAAYGLAAARRREIDIAQRAVAAARESYVLNEDRVRRAPDQGRPIELLQAIQALARASQDYLNVVAEYNRVQFRLYHAIGKPPLHALDEAQEIETKLSTIPPPKAKSPE